MVDVAKFLFGSLNCAHGRQKYVLSSQDPLRKKDAVSYFFNLKEKMHAARK